MTLILILKHIDLSVGYVAGFSGAVAAILLTKYSLNVWLSILLVLLLGLAIGFYQGTLVTRVKVPAFVTTLAGMFIFRGLLNLTLQETGTIIIPDATFNALSNGFIPDLPGVSAGVHVLTLLIGAVAIVLMVFSMVQDRRNKQKYNFPVTSMPVFLIRMVFIAAIIAAIVWLLAAYAGLPWTAVIVAAVLFIYNFMRPPAVPTSLFRRVSAT